MAGRKRAVPKEIVHQIFEENVSSFVKENKVVAEKEGIEIWKQIQSDERINNGMTTKAIYTEALKWFKSKKRDASSSKVEDIADKFKEISFEASESSEFSDGCSDDEFFKKRSNEIVFTVNLSYEVWETIKPVPKDCTRNDKSHKTHSRKYYVLQPGVWTNVLIERISKHPKKIICTWSFKRSKVHMNSDKFITISGKCSTCAATLIGYVEKKPKESENVQFCFKMFGFDEKKHAESRRNVRIGGSKAKELFTSSKIASVLRGKSISKSGAQMFEQPIGRDVSANAIRCGQYRERQSNKLSNEPMQALEYLKESNAYSAMIHMISLSPVSVIYGSPNQFKLYDAYRKHSSYRKVCCDGTGGIVHKLGKFKLYNELLFCDILFIFII